MDVSLLTVVVDARLYPVVINGKNTIGISGSRVYKIVNCYSEL